MAWRLFGTKEGTKVLEKRDDAPESSTPESSTPEIPRRSSASASVSSSEALGLGAVYRAVAIRASAIRQLSIDVERGGEEIARPLIIRRPNESTTLGAFLEQTVNSRALSGNAYWRVSRDAAGVANALDVLNPLDVTIETTASGRVTGYQYRGRTYAPSEIVHLPKLRTPGTPYGLGPIQAARTEIRGAIDTSQYANEFLTSGEAPSGILSIKQHVTDEEAVDIKKRLKESQGGRRDVAVLGGDATYSPVLLSAADAQWIESRQFDTIAIARLFGVPASLMLVGIEGSSLTYSNLAQEWLSFVKWGLADDIVEIEDAFTSVLPRGQRARFNVEAFLRLDTASRYAMHREAIAMGLYSAEYAREIEKIPESAAPTLGSSVTPPEAKEAA